MRWLSAGFVLAWVCGCAGSDTSASATASASASAGAVASASVSASATATATASDRAAAWATEPMAAGAVPSALLRGDATPAPKELPRYEIDQAIDDVSGRFAGKLKLRYLNPSAGELATLPLLLHPNAAAELGETQAGSLRVSEVRDEQGGALPFVSPRPGLVNVTLATPIAAGAPIHLHVQYEGKLRQLPPNVNDLFAQGLAALGSIGGAGAADYGLLAAGDGILTAASAYPMVAPFRDGAFDTTPPARLGDLAYNGVASFRVRTLVPAGVSIVTNLSDAAPEPASKSGAVLVRSEGEWVRDFVLVGGRDLERSHKQVGATRVTSIFRARDRAAGERVLEAAAGALASYEKRFGPYPYAELDVAEASLVGGAGGVEFSGLVLIAGMLYRPPELSQSPLASLLKMWGSLGAGLETMGEPQAPKPPAAYDPQKQLEGTLDTALEFTVDHEVAHQYFAGLVGNDSHRFPSLDEPLAQYLAGLAFEDRHGAEAAKKAMDGNVKLNYALYRMLGGVDRPVLRDTDAFRTSIEYAALVYGKAPYLYVTLRKELGDARLHGAMRDAVAKHRFELVSTPAWIDALAQGKDGPKVRATFRRYLEQAHGDADLAVDDGGDFVLRSMFPPDVVAALEQSTATLGMKPRDLLRMMFGGALGDDAPLGAGIDPFQALEQLGR